MKRVSDMLRRDPVWVNPAHRVESAILLMQGHDLGGLPVLDGPALVGVVMYKHLLGVERQRRVEEVMDRNVNAIPSSLSIREVADLMIRERLTFLPVMEEEALVGVITSTDLLSALRRAVDPTTELPWSDSLREWAVEKLQAGLEITLLFIDINDFGHFNKRYGHIIGDTVLRTIANVLREIVDPQIDSLCRYGGDEFCIASLRSAPDAIGLAGHIEREIVKLRLPEADDRGVSVEIGLRGGRRTREREPIHYAATLNNLINLASQDCTKKKEQRRREEQRAGGAGSESFLSAAGPLSLGGQEDEEQAQEAGLSVSQETALVSTERTALVRDVSSSQEPDFLRLAALDVSWTGRTAHVHVGLERSVSAPVKAAGTEKTGRAVPAPSANGRISGTTVVYYESDLSRALAREDLPDLVAQATVAALRRVLPEGYDLILDEVIRAQVADGRTLVTVIGQFLTPDDRRALAGSAFVGADLNRTVAAAVLASANRQLMPLLRRRAPEE